MESIINVYHRWSWKPRKKKRNDCITARIRHKWNEKFPNTYRLPFLNDLTISIWICLLYRNFSVCDSINIYFLKISLVVICKNNTVKCCKNILYVSMQWFYVSQFRVLVDGSSNQLKQYPSDLFHSQDSKLVLSDWFIHAVHEFALQDILLLRLYWKMAKNVCFSC